MMGTNGERGLFRDRGQSVSVWQLNIGGEGGKGGGEEHSPPAVTISLYECLICIHGAALAWNHWLLQIHKKIFKKHL